VDSCVGSLTECDCPELMTKCPTLGGKCYPSEQFSQFCPPFTNSTCSNEKRFTYRCIDGSCRLNESSCASKLACPIGFFLCPDDTCIRCLQPNCSLDDFNRCLVKTPSNCSQKVSEALGILENREKVLAMGIDNFMDVVVQSEDGFKCSDQRCVFDIASCPSKITCQNPYNVVCPDGTCVTNEQFCPRLRECPVNTPFLCQDQRCVRSRTDCNPI
jgi:hypothetical protein